MLKQIIGLKQQMPHCTPSSYVADVSYSPYGLSFYKVIDPLPKALTSFKDDPLSQTIQQWTILHKTYFCK